MREENQALHNDLTTVQQLYKEAQRDNQLLRDTLYQHESRKKESNCQTNGKMRLIEQLEEAQNKVCINLAIIVLFEELCTKC